MSGTDVVYINGIEFEASHGYTAAERKLTRRFRCSVELSRDLSVPARSDRIQDTIDYRTICGIVIDIGTGPTLRLIETLAGSITAAIHERYPAVGLSVTVEKLGPPCPGAPALAGVRLVRPPRI